MQTRKLLTALSTSPRDGALICVSGRSRSGKTEFVKRAIRGESCVFVWDIEEQYCQLPGFVAIRSPGDLLRIVADGARGKYAYIAAGEIKKQFDFFSGAVHYYGKMHGQCVAVAEELADVTAPAKAPGKWGLLLRRGLKRGITIYAISQRWAEADKTALGNASGVVVFQSATADDARYIAQKTRLTVDQIESLKPLEYIVYATATGRTFGGKIEFGAGRAEPGPARGQPTLEQAGQPVLEIFG